MLISELINYHLVLCGELFICLFDRNNADKELNDDE